MIHRRVALIGAVALLGGCIAAEAGEQQAAVAPLVVRVLDVGQGDAVLIENGGSRVLIDGGPSVPRMGELLDSLHLNNSTFDVVILTHLHADHLVGLRALFESARHIKVRFFYESQDPATGGNLARLRDSVIARQGRRELVYRDTDDPCANGRPVCTITMKGGAKLHIMRPLPASTNANDRSAPVKLVAADSTSFSMWLAGDAERDEIAWFLGPAHYDVNPGMHVDVLKANHHGSCNGVTDAYLNALRPRWVVASVGTPNAYGHMHTQAKTMFRAHHLPWYRTDKNGTIEIRSTGARGVKFTVSAHGVTDMRSVEDKHSTQAECKTTPTPR